VRVRTPRVELPDDDGGDNEAKLRQEEEDRGYEGMIRPLYLGEGGKVGDSGQEEVYDALGAATGEGGRKGPSVMAAARRSSEAVVP
jgi:hypothetical protein